MKHLLFAAASFVLAALPGVAHAQALEPLTVKSGDKVHAFQVEVADSEEETQRGLMNRAELGKDRGMIFDFGQPRETGMWMKNTLIPLDMLFLDTDGTVLAIAENARPHSLRVINPGFVVKGVLEINGGQSAELGIKPGDTVVHPIFKPKANGG
jgi:uncharacterized membrane protein (UPF0127 family)